MKSILQPSFTKNPLDRMDHLRESIDSFLATTPGTQVVYILVSGDNLIVHENELDYLFNNDELVSMGISNEHSIFLGAKNSTYYFAKLIEPAVGEQFKFIGLRSFALQNWNTEDDMGILAQAFSVISWHETHQFCPACGVKNKMMLAGWRQDCPGCGRQHFPRTDPVVIMLVTYGDYCLLGSGLNFDKNRYSCLAGFMEPGETIENAARRELFEEAGVVGLDVRYVLSQPWPFPFSLMIGVHVIAEGMELNIDYNELADARWMDKSEVAAVLNGAEDLGFMLPPKIAIARTLLEYWINS